MSRSDAPAPSGEFTSPSEIASPGEIGSTVRALRDDERRRTRAFLWVSGGLAVCGAVAAPVVGGNRTSCVAFIVGVVAMLVAYVVFGRQLVDPARYRPGRALPVVTAANLSGVLAALHYGVFSPASMCLMLPIAYFGLTESTRAATASAVVTGVALAVPSALIAVDVLPDPGLVTGAGLSVWQRLGYVGLVQLVLAAGFLLARTSRSATTRAIAALVDALAQADVDRARADEANAALQRALASCAAGPLTGTALGAWSLGVLLGRGGSGEVYEAVHQDGRVGALKSLRSEQLLDPVATELFLREARLLGTIDHPGVVRVLDVSRGPRPYLVTERLHGQDLASLLRTATRLEPREVVRLIDEIAAGLDAVHAAGVLHRDIKPSNLFQARSSTGAAARWVLLDFGVSSAIDEHSPLTRGILLGTPAYMSPEQVRAGSLDIRSDVFSLAAVAYRALTGRPAFSGANPHATLLSVVERRPRRPSGLVPVSTVVDDVFTLGLAKDPQARPATARAFAAALGAALGGDAGFEIQRAARTVRQAELQR
jgi:tRNA A-37 threonylcarbamoyl transferase component Bud32